MALSIKNLEVEHLAREVAVLKNKPITVALHEALLREKRYEQSLKRKPVRDDFIEKIREIQREVAALPILDSRHPDDILYDDYGLPK
jgi:antitoxin VapB